MEKKGDKQDQNILAQENLHVLAMELLPLYLENALSEKAEESLANHLMDCRQCREELALLQGAGLPTDDFMSLSGESKLSFSSSQQTSEDVHVLKGFRRKFRKRKLITITVAVFFTAVLIIGLYGLLVGRETPMAFDPATMTITQRDGKLFADISQSRGTIFVKDVPTNQGNNQGFIAYYYTESLWDKYGEPLFAWAKSESNETQSFYLGETNKIDRIYYDEFYSDFGERSLKTDQQIQNQGKLVWQK